jgi:hypothetical protein
MGLMLRGRTWTSIPEGSLGLTKDFPDIDWDSSESIKPQHTNMRVTCRLVQNDSGGTLAGKLHVKYKSTNWGTEIGAVCGAGEPSDGVVDEYLTTTVADQSYFWLVVKGPTLMTNSTATAIAQGDPLVTAADGKVVEMLTDIDLAKYTGICGRAMAAVAATADVTFRAYVQLIGGS